MLDIYFKCPDKFSDLVPVLGGFHMAKCVHRCIGKYIKDTGLEDALVETGVFGPKVIESFIAGTDYVRSMSGIQILSTATQMVKWKAFWTMHDRTEFTQVIDNLQNLSEALKEKNQQKCQQIFNDSKENIQILTEQYNKFSMLCKERSQLCKYWDGIITLSNMLKNLVSADREGNWERHLQAVQTFSRSSVSLIVKIIYVILHGALKKCVRCQMCIPKYTHNLWKENLLVKQPMVRSIQCYQI